MRIANSSNYRNMCQAATEMQQLLIKKGHGRISGDVVMIDEVVSVIIDAEPTEGGTVYTSYKLYPFEEGEFGFAEQNVRHFLETDEIVILPSLSVMQEIIIEQNQKTARSVGHNDLHFLYADFGSWYSRNEAELEYTVVEEVWFAFMMRLVFWKKWDYANKEWV